VRASKRATALTALLIVLAAATILMSPDPTDDVDGVLRSHERIKIPPRLAIPNLTLTIFTCFQSLPSVASADFSRLLCGLRC